MYIDTVPNRNSPPAILLRESSRVGNKIIKRTLANLSDSPAPQVDLLRRVLRRESLVSFSDALKLRARCLTAMWLLPSAPCAALVWNRTWPAPPVPNAIWSAL